MSTIYALSTSFTKSAIGIIRVSGPDYYKSVNKLLKKTNLKPLKANFCNIFNYNDEIIDEAIVIYFPKENSYNGEDIVEYHVHGSLAVIKEVLEELSLIPNYKLAEPGEFTRRALENNKLSLTQVEGVIDLINAETYFQRKQAIRELKNEIGDVYNNWYQEIKNILAFFEASIDFSDEEIPQDLFDKSILKLTNLLDVMKNEYTKANKIRKIKEGINVAIIGIPNVGKSSLINYLSNKDIAIVSDIKGTTRDVLESFVDIEGFPVLMYDTAGIRESDNEIEKEGIKRALIKAEESDIKIIMIDATNFEESYQQVSYLIDENSIILINKSDLNSDYSFKQKHFLISLKNKQGIDSFKIYLLERLKEITAVYENPIILKHRYSSIIANVIKEIELSIIHQNDSIIASFHLRNAVNDLGKILGKANIEDILAIIFNNFCIGK